MSVTFGMRFTGAASDCDTDEYGVAGDKRAAAIRVILRCSISYSRAGHLVTSPGKS